MATNLPDILVEVSLIALILVAFSGSISIVYYSKSYLEEVALSIAVKELNDAIQAVYGKPLSSVTIKLYLPSGSWISIENSTIKLSKKTELKINDPNKIIIGMNDDMITYLVRFSTLLINENINYLLVMCLNPSQILIKETL